MIGRKNIRVKVDELLEGTRYGEDLVYINYGKNEKSRVAHDFLNLCRFVEKSLLKLILHVIDRRLLDSYERLEIIK